MEAMEIEQTDKPLKGDVKMEIEFKHETPKITELDFTGHPIKDFSILYQFPELRKLTWRNLPNTDLVLLYTMYRNPLLQYLDIGRDSCNMGQLIQAKPPSEYISKNLLSLNLAGTIDMTNQILHHLVKSHPHLIDLNLSCTKLLHINALSKLTALTSLNVSHNFLNDHDARKLATQFNLIQLDISHNELTDKGVQVFLDNKTLRQLNVSDQHTHYVKPQTIESLSMIIEPMITPTKPVQDMKMEIETKTHFNTYENNLVDFRLIYEQFPNVTDMYISPQTGEEDFSFIPKFKHLQSLTIQTISVKTNDSIVDIGKSKTITKLKLLGMWQLGNNLKFAHALKNNSVLQSVRFSHCSLSEEFVKIILQSMSIQHLDISNNEPRLDQSIIPFILKNDVLFDIELEWFDKFFNMIFTQRQIDQISEHLKENKKTITALQQILPLLAATQLGGSLRHSLTDTKISEVLPMISELLGIEQPERETVKSMSQQIEPIVQLGRRTRSQMENKPLPFMFEKPQI